MTPDHPERAALECPAAGQQHKFLGHMKSVGMDTHAPVGGVCNDAIEWGYVVPELDFRQSCAALARPLASVLNGLQHDARPLLRATLAESDSPSVEMLIARKLPAN